MVPIAWMAAYYLRFELGPIPEPYESQALALIPLLIVVQGGVFWYFGLYRGVWRFASMPDMQRRACARPAAIEHSCRVFEACSMKPPRWLQASRGPIAVRERRQ